MKSDWAAWEAAMDWLEGQLAAAVDAGDEEAADAAEFAFLTLESMGSMAMAAMKPANRLAV